MNPRVYRKRQPQQSNPIPIKFRDGLRIVHFDVIDVRICAVKGILVDISADLCAPGVQPWFLITLRHGTHHLPFTSNIVTLLNKYYYRVYRCGSLVPSTRRYYDGHTENEVSPPALTIGDRDYIASKVAEFLDRSKPDWGE